MSHPATHPLPPTGIFHSEHFYLRLNFWLSPFVTAGHNPSIRLVVTAHSESWSRSVLEIIFLYDDDDEASKLRVART